VRKGTAEKISFQITAENLQGRCRREVTVHSRHEQRRPEKLSRWQSTTMYNGQSVTMTTLSKDDLEPRRLEEPVNEVWCLCINTTKWKDAR